MFTIQMSFALPIIPIGMALYYLLWRHAVAFLNREMAIACGERPHRAYASSF